MAAKQYIVNGVTPTYVSETGSRSEAINDAYLTEAATIAPTALNGGNIRLVERITGATLNIKTPLQGYIRSVIRDAGRLGSVFLLSGIVRSGQRLGSATLSGKSALSGKVAEQSRLSSAALPTKTRITGAIKALQGSPGARLSIIGLVSLSGYIRSLIVDKSAAISSQIQLGGSTKLSMRVDSATVTSSIGIAGTIKESLRIASAIASSKSALWGSIKGIERVKSGTVSSIVGVSGKIRDIVISKPITIISKIGVTASKIQQQARGLGATLRSYMPLHGSKIVETAALQGWLGMVATHQLYGKVSAFAKMSGASFSSAIGLKGSKLTIAGKSNNTTLSSSILLAGKVVEQIRVKNHALFVNIQLLLSAGRIVEASRVAASTLRSVSALKGKSTIAGRNIGGPFAMQTGLKGLVRHVIRLANRIIGNSEQSVEWVIFEQQNNSVLVTSAAVNSVVVCEQMNSIIVETTKTDKVIDL